MKKLWKNTNLEEIFAFCEEYKDFISSNKTERDCVESIRNIAKDNGFKSLEEMIKNGEKLKANDKVFASNLDKCIFLFHIGSRSLEEGMRIVGSHIDSPRLDLKPTPLYQDQVSSLALLDTHYYGGIKHYQWTAIPLAMHGIICKKNGENVKLSIGDEENQPVFCISDLLPHLDKEISKSAENKIIGENLNVLVGGIPLESKENEKVKANIVEILKEYGVELDDFLSAEIEIVPAGKARDMGLDKSFVLGYGQDDRICAYTSLKAFLEVKNPEFTTVCMFVDKEEVGSQGASGMQSLFFEDMVAEISSMLGYPSHLSIRRALRNSLMLSSDVTAGYDPNYEGVFDKNNDAFLGAGIAFNKYTGGKGKNGANDASPEYIAKLRHMLESENINYQLTEMGKIDQGGGGTIAYITANYGMNVIDCGCPLLNMHAPWEISSKADIFEAYRCYKAFLSMGKR